ncbi:MAG: hypothetical protein KKF77_14475 [Proteobacteria bacterium]|nr:hypothetical protein [Pseudomonadota bacterium]
MQRKVLLAALVALVALGGCAQRDPNLLVRGLGEFSRAKGDYTLTIKTYELDAAGNARLAASEDASTRGFVERSLADKGYILKASGPARYAMQVHLLCADTRKASLGLVAEEVRLPAQAVGAGYSEDIHYWLPDQKMDMANPGQSTLASRREEMSPRLRAGGSPHERAPGVHVDAPMGKQEPAFCQGRVLVTLTPAGPGPLREVFVGRRATDDCAAVPNCPLTTCRTALEQTLVYELDTRF